MPDPYDAAPAATPPADPHPGNDDELRRALNDLITLTEHGSRPPGPAEPGGADQAAGRASAFAAPPPPAPQMWVGMLFELRAMRRARLISRRQYRKLRRAAVASLSASVSPRGIR